MTLSRTAATLVGAAVLSAAPIAAHAATSAPADSTSGPGISFSARGSLKPGSTVSFDAQCGVTRNGKGVIAAEVTGPSGVRASLRPVNKSGHLVGSVALPKGFSATTAQFKLVCDNLGTATSTVKAQPATNAPADSTSGPGISFFASGSPKPGSTVSYDAQCGVTRNGKGVLAAEVTGPSGVRASLRPVDSHGHLVGVAVLPKGFSATTAQFKLVCDNLGTATTPVKARAAGAQGSSATGAHASGHQVTVTPKGAPQTGGEPGDDGFGAGAAVGAGALLLLGTGVAARRIRSTR